MKIILLSLLLSSPIAPKKDRTNYEFSRVKPAFLTVDTGTGV
jgi:hypothetical protein